MRTLFILKLAILFSMPQMLFSQNVYRFIGNGSWKEASNWLNNAIPPVTLASGDSIIIDPDGECILDLEQSIAEGAKLIVNPGKKFTILGYLKQNTDSTFTDPRDGRKYPYKTIGTQVWMTKNLNYTVTGSWCYDDNAANCAIYGRLYDWNTALTAAPAGWHLPSDAEWTTLTVYLGGQTEAGGAMKSTDIWTSPNTGATNSSGFSGLPGGIRSLNGTYKFIDGFGYWWSSTEYNSSYAWNRNLYYYNSSFLGYYYNKNFGFSVRCVKD